MINTLVFVSQDYDVAIKPSAPAAIYINQHGNHDIGCYVYTVPRKADSSVQTFTSLLQATKDNSVHDLAVSLSSVVAKRTLAPAYVCMSGHIPANDYTQLAKEVLDIIQQHK